MGQWGKEEEAGGGGGGEGIQFAVNSEAKIRNQMLTGRPKN